MALETTIHHLGQMALETTIDDLGIDLLQNIVSRLPALSFASADCVSCSWNHVCGRVLCRPKLSSACSFNPSLQIAVEDVVNKVLSEPIRPHFVIVSVGHRFSSKASHQLITAKLGSKVHLITNVCNGIIRRDATSNEFKETRWGWKDGAKVGILLTVGFVPGVKVKAISLPKDTEDPEGLYLLIHQFVTDIRDFSTSISGRQSPAAIMIFGEYPGDMDFVMEKLDCAMSPETVIVGDCSYDPRHTPTLRLVAGRVSVVVLVFVMDKKKPPGIGETRFHAVLSSGLSPVGPTYTVDNITENSRDYETVYLSGRRDGPFETIAEDKFPGIGMSIGVRKRKIYSFGEEKPKWKTSFAFHMLLTKDDEDESLCVEDVGIREGDTFRLYCPDSNTARSSVDKVSNLFRSFKQKSTNGNDKWEVCGGLIFTSSGRETRDLSFLGQPNAESSAFFENFPGVTLGGTGCLQQIGRGCLIPQESKEQKSARACVHQYSAVYLIISYAP